MCPLKVDETTICRFCNGLIKLKVLDRPLDMINGRIGSNDLLVREGAVVDASVVESQRRPRKVIDVMPQDREEDRDEEEEAASSDGPAVRVQYPDDEDAAWLRQGNRAYYGYKIHRRLSKS